MKINNNNEKQYKLNNKNDVSFTDARKFKVANLIQYSVNIRNIFSICKAGLDMEIYMGVIYFDKFMDL